MNLRPLGYEQIVDVSAVASDRVRVLMTWPYSAERLTRADPSPAVPEPPGYIFGYSPPDVRAVPPRRAGAVSTLGGELRRCTESPLNRHEILTGQDRHSPYIRDP
ncbi:hypothetical protein GCM10010170_066150 [Dactylosporangium salmoneum]|uniref:Uncharacterized protein n=1 Tax=Dactylosporangium salmoneum TaxID=53361 RepID=A0ABP5U1A6_9ACTN